MRGSTAGLVGRGGTAGVDSGSGTDTDDELSGLTGIIKAAAGVASAATAGTDYVAPGGVAGGQTIKGDTASAGNLTLMSTNHATKGKVQVTSTLFADEANKRVGVGQSAGTPGYPLDVVDTAGTDRTVARFRNTGTSANPQVIIDDANASGNAWLSLRVGGANKAQMIASDSGAMYIMGSAAAYFGTGTLTIDSTSRAVGVDSAGVVRFCSGVQKDVVIGPAALATTATEGFLWIPTCAGAPTGTPAGTYTGMVPFVFDTTNNKLYVRDGGAWIATAALT